MIDAAVNWPRVTAFVIFLFWLAGYAVSCWWFPFARCWRCGGRGRIERKGGRVFRNCRWCKATGRRLRIGRRIYNRSRSERKRAESNAKILRGRWP